MLDIYQLWRHVLKLLFCSRIILFLCTVTVTMTTAHRMMVAQRFVLLASGGWHQAAVEASWWKHAALVTRCFISPVRRGFGLLSATLHLVDKEKLYYSAPAEERSFAISVSVCLCVCLSASISLEPLDRSSRNFLCRSPVAVARSSLCGVAIHYVLPVLWTTSRLAVVGRMAMRGRLNLYPTTTSGVAIPGRSLMSMNALFSKQTW